MNNKEVHEFIWDYVIDGIKQQPRRNVYVLKDEAVDELLYKDEIDDADNELLHRNDCCVLCMLFKKHEEQDDGRRCVTCTDCPLKLHCGVACGNIQSVYQTVINLSKPVEERIGAATVIRNIMRDTTLEDME